MAKTTVAKTMFDAVEKLGGLSPNIKVEGWINKDDFGFSRDFAIEVRGQRYVLNVWANYSNLICGELVVLFDQISFNGHWPNRFKNNLEFRYRGNIVAILPVDEWEVDDHGTEE